MGALSPYPGRGRNEWKGEDMKEKRGKRSTRERQAGKRRNAKGERDGTEGRDRI